MRTIALALLLGLSGTAFSQQFKAPEIQYLMNKKDVGLGLVLSLILPGGGHLYAQNHPADIVFVTAEIGLLAGYFITASKGEVYPGLATAYLIVKIVDLICVPSAVKRYNDKLLKQLDLQVGPKGITARLYF